MSLRQTLLGLGLLVVLSACGQSPTPALEANRQQNRVIGGDKVARTERVSLSTVAIVDPASRKLCSGTLIAPKVVMTAGHCVSDGVGQKVVIFGTEVKKAPANFLRKVVRVAAHPKYLAKANKDMHDIALVWLEEPAPEGFKIASLLTDGSKIEKGAKLRVAGFGLNWSWGVHLGSGTLRSTLLKVKETSFGAGEFVLDQSLRHGVCSGDSGGPAYLERNDELILAGVVSRGDSIPIPLTPNCFILSVFTRVDAYLPWVNEMLHGL